MRQPSRSLFVRSLVAFGFVLGSLAFTLSGAAASGTAGYVYAITNAANGNQLVQFARQADGTLTPGGSFATGGNGTGVGLGSQGAVVISGDHHWLFAVNAGSNSFSVFRLTGAGPALVDVIGSDGTMPISLAQSGKLIYVLDAGGAGNIAGFAINPVGRLREIPHSVRPLSGSNTNPAEIAFSADGGSVIVTERNTQQIDTYQVQPNGRVDGPNVQPSVGVTPYGFAVDPANHLIVSEAGTGALSSYQIAGNGDLTVISPSVSTHQTAACWVTLAGSGMRFAYTTNAGSNSISGYLIGSDGSLTLLNANGITGMTGPHPTDMATSRDGQFLYARNGDGTISAFQVLENGQLSALTGAGGLPASATGLAGL